MKELSEVSLKELLESGAHFGHQTRRWNPKMGQYIYGARGGIHIIDLTKTADQLQKATQFVEQVTATGGLILFVGTKRQAKGIIKQAAQSIAMPFVCERWLGGMLTNFRTIKIQVNRLKDLVAKHENGDLSGYNKKEQSVLRDEMNRLEQIFGGIVNMDNPPAAMFVCDAHRDDIAVAEANKLGIPVVAISDTNTDPSLVQYPIPANDDAVKSLSVITGAIAAAAERGSKLYQAKVKADDASAQAAETKAAKAKALAEQKVAKAKEELESAA